MLKTKINAKCILMDLDGTVLDSRGAYLEAAKKAFKAVGAETFDVTLVTEIPKRLEQNLPIGALLSGIDAKRFLDVYLETYYRATAHTAKPIKNVEETLSNLGKKAKLALITRRHVPCKQVIQELEKFHLAQYFRQVITALDTKTPKPSPEALMQCLRKMNCEAGSCLVVGDSVVDVKAGKNAGIKTVAVLSGIYSRGELEKENPDLILESINELPDFVK
jgi:HAD superfamily hydrolase (TIGR01509 family)